MIDALSDRPVYRQLADLLRAKIVGGEYGPGDALPSEIALMERHGLGRNTVRQAVALLREEGLVVTRQARGTFVRDALPVRRLSSDRYRRAPQRRGSGAGGTAEAIHREVPADPAVAEQLRVAAGTPLLERRALLLERGLPQQLSVSYVPLELLAGTPMADPARGPWPGGTVAALAGAGVRVTAVREVVRARMPRPEETRSLAVAVGTPMLAITRTMFAGERVVEAAVEIVVPGDRGELEYHVDVR